MKFLSLTCYIILLSLLLSTTSSALQITKFLPIRNNYEVWAKHIQRGAEEVLKFINSNTRDDFELEKTVPEESIVLGGVFYSVQAQLSSGQSVQSRFLDRLYTKFDWVGMSSNNETTPRFQTLQLCGPVELHFNPPSSVELYLPKIIETGSLVSHISLHKGVCLDLMKAYKFEVSDLSISNVTNLKNQQEYNVQIDGTPKLRVKGNIPTFSSQRKIKVKRAGPTHLSLFDPEDVMVKKESLNSTSLVVPERFLSTLLPQENSNLLSDGSPLPSLRRLKGDAEAVNIYRIVMNVKKKNKQREDWEAVVMQNAEDQHQVLSVEKRGSKLSVAFDISLAINGTLPLQLANLPPEIKNSTHDYVVS